MKKFFYSLAVIVSNFFLLSVAHAVTISMNIPGVNTTASSTPGTFIANFYQFALMIGGVLAFGIIVYGGVRYMTSAGNPSGQSDAKEWIEAALLGLLLLVGAYFILNVVNPQMTNLGLPTLTPLAITPATTQGAIQADTTACIAACKDATCVATCNNAGKSLAAAFVGSCSVNTCPSTQTCQNDATGGHLCLSLTSLPAVPSNLLPPGEYASCKQANCPASQTCTYDLNSKGYYICQ
jgi:hypothetical protein